MYKMCQNRNENKMVFIVVITFLIHICVSASSRSMFLQKSSLWASAVDGEVEGEDTPKLTSTPRKQGFVCSTWKSLCFKVIFVRQCDKCDVLIVVRFFSAARSHIWVQRQHREHQESLTDPGRPPGGAGAGARPDGIGSIWPTVRWKGEGGETEGGSRWERERGTGRVREKEEEKRGQ